MRAPCNQPGICRKQFCKHIDSMVTSAVFSTEEAVLECCSC
jgi:hypothetical protein